MVLLNWLFSELDLSSELLSQVLDALQQKGRLASNNTPTTQPCARNALVPISNTARATCLPLAFLRPSGSLSVFVSSVFLIYLRLLPVCSLSFPWFPLSTFLWFCPALFTALVLPHPPLSRLSYFSVALRPFTCPLVFYHDFGFPPFSLFPSFAFCSLCEVRGASSLDRSGCAKECV